MQLRSGRIRGANAAVIKQFVVEALTQSASYDRAAGYFAVSVFDVALEAWRGFFEMGGQVRLVCSPTFDHHTGKILHKTLYAQHREPRLLLRSVQTAADLAGWAHESGRLWIKVAVPDGTEGRGIYHEKFGLFTSPRGDIGFEGSANETGAAYVRNYERFTLYDGSGSDTDRVAVGALKEQFQRLWSDSTEGLRVLDLHSAFKEEVVQLESRNIEGEQPGEPYALSSEPEILRSPPGVTLRDYQEDAKRAWFHAGGKGILAMATGTGKTFTALSILHELQRRTGGPLVVVIVAPLLHLVDQWIEVGREWGLDPIRCAGLRSSWEGRSRSAAYLVNRGKRSLLSLAVSNATFSTDHFQAVLSDVQVRTVIVADEVHNFGAPALRNTLPERINLRLGLSATPERHHDEIGTRAVFEYFNGEVFSFGLEEALQYNPPILTPYRYYPVPVQLEPAEADEYIDLSRRIAVALLTGDEDTLDDRVLPLLLRRARIVGAAAGKIAALRSVIAPHKDQGHILVYCGDGSVASEAAAMHMDVASEEMSFHRHVDIIAKLLGNDLDMAVAKYTAETPPERRRQLEKDFASGKVQALVAIRCLDEGVDIPEVRRAFILASSTNPRQYVQRRGRVLRRAEGKDRAEIFDFLVVPPEELLQEDAEILATLRRLTEREMERVVEFAHLAVNGPEARLRLQPVLKPLSLTHL